MFGNDLCVITNGQVRSKFEEKTTAFVHFCLSPNDISNFTKQLAK